jgi:hypothetical protein
MRLDCKITDRIREEFDTLWRCEQRGNTLEIATPYRMPDSTLFTLFLTQRAQRYIACDGGRIWELLRERCELEEKDWLAELRALAKAHGLKEGSDEGTPVFFKDCQEEKLIGSISFDVANFATMAANVLLSIDREEEDEKEKETRFQRDADTFIRSVLRPDQTLQKNHQIDRGPDVRFSAVISSSSNLWIVSYIGGAGPSLFRKNISDAAYSFKEAWESPLGKNGRIKRTIPLLNSRARGYQPRRLAHRLSELKHEAKQEPLSWSENYQLERLLTTEGTNGKLHS